LTTYPVAPAEADHDKFTWLALAAVAFNPVGGGGACGVPLVTTAKFQFAPPLLSHVPASLLNTQFKFVAVVGTVTVYCHQFDAALKLIAASGETTGFQLFQPR
jgi:hypothetical protein